MFVSKSIQHITTMTANHQEVTDSRSLQKMLRTGLHWKKWFIIEN